MTAHFTIYRPRESRIDWVNVATWFGILPGVSVTFWLGVFWLLGVW